MPKLARLCTFLLFTAVASAAAAQAPPTGPVLLLLPAGPRATALGNAWVAGRDEHVVFYNPALVGPTTGFGASFARYGDATAIGTLTYGVTVGRFSLGWGARIASYEPLAGTTLPMQPAELTERGDDDALSVLAVAAGNMTIGPSRVGVSLKYAEDRITQTGGGTAPRHAVLYADAGLSRPMFSGVGAISVQNMGSGRGSATPLQTSVGWSRGKIAKELDLVFAGSVTVRDFWVTPGAGIEAGYGWIEGWSTALRLGARKPETEAQRPVSAGWTLNADRLGLDYAVEFFADSRYAHHLSLRWR